MDEVTAGFILSSARNFGYCALELADGEIMLNRMKFESNGSVLIELTIKVFPDFYWQIYMLSKQLSASKPYLEHLPPLLTIGNTKMFLKHMIDAKLCPCNHDFSDIIFHKISQGVHLNFYDKNEEIRAKIENSKLNSYDKMSTIRTIACSILISKNEIRCSSCVEYKKVLTVTATRISNYDPNNVSRNMPNKYMTTNQRNLKLVAIQREQKAF